MSEIIIGYDGSDSSKTALGQALGFAKALGDSIVVVFGARARRLRRRRGPRAAQGRGGVRPTR